VTWHGGLTEDTSPTSPTSRRVRGCTTITGIGIALAGRSGITGSARGACSGITGRDRGARSGGARGARSGRARGARSGITGIARGGRGPGGLAQRHTMRVDLLVDISSDDGSNTTDDQIQRHALNSLAPGLSGGGLGGISTDLGGGIFADLGGGISTDLGGGTSTDLGGDLFADLGAEEVEEASLSTGQVGVSESLLPSHPKRIKHVRKDRTTDI
jgi:hypothetical protein